mgnify:CR=1 FL=1
MNFTIFKKYLSANPDPIFKNANTIEVIKIIKNNIVFNIIGNPGINKIPKEITLPITYSICLSDRYPPKTFSSCEKSYGTL